MASEYDYIRNFKSGKTISEILHDAADKFLAAHPYNYDSRTQTSWTCLAILRALLSDDKSIDAQWECYDKWKKYNTQYKQIIQGLYNMGLKTSDGMGTIFKDEYPTQRQQVRYGWLKMAAMLAEEQEARGEI